jgi:hypothetical protein
MSIIVGGSIAYLNYPLSVDTDRMYCACLLPGWLGAATAFVWGFGVIYSFEIASHSIN